MATTFVEYTGDGNATKQFTFPSFQESDVKVRVDDVLKTASTHYNITNYTTTGGGNIVFTSGNIPSSPAKIHIYRDTNVDSAKATYQAGASVKEADLNNNHKQLLYRAQEEQVPNLIQSYDIATDGIVGSNIRDNQIDGGHLQNAIITTAKLQDNSVATAKIIDGNVTRAKIEADAIDSTKLADNAVNSEHYVDGSIDRVHLAADIIDGTKIADDSINSEHLIADSIDSEHYAPGSVNTVAIEDTAVTTAKITDGNVTTAKIADSNVTTAKIANSAVTANKIADGTVGTLELANSSVTTAKIADTNVTTAKIADSAVTNAKINNLAVDNSKLGIQAVTFDKIATATIVSGNIANGNITEGKIADNAVTTAKIANGNITTAKIGAGQVILDKLADNSVNTSRIIDNAVTIDKIADAAIVTNSEQASHSVDDNTFFTTAAAEARYFNASTGETIKDGQSFPDNDTTIATTAAINDRIIDLVDDVGGFVPIANETSFPNTNPDVNNGTGTIVSVSTLASNHTSNGSGVITISNGTVGNSTVTINGAGNNITYSAGYGLLVETTSTLNTYTFHRLVPKATEVTTVAGKATEIGRLGTADAVADMAILGTADVVADLNTLGTADVVADMNLLATSDVISDMNTLAVTDVINDMDTVAGAVTNVNNVGNSIANVNTTAGSISNVNTVAGSIANVNTTAGSISNVNTTAGSISNVNTVASNISNVNNFADRYQIASNNPSTDGGGNALAAGDLYFNTSANELKVYNGSAWQSGVTATGNFALTTGNTFTGNNIFTAHNTYNDSVIAKFGTGEDLQIYHNGSHSYLDNSTGSLFVRGDTIKLRPKSVDEDGIEVFANGEVRLYYDNSKKLHTTSNGVYVTGNIELPDDGEVKFGNSGDLAIYHNDSLGSSWIANSTGALNIRSDSIFLRSQSDAASYINCTDNGSVDLYYNGSKKLETTNTGATITGTLIADGLAVYDSEKIELGNNNDLELFHDGTDNIIQSDTGDLLINSGNSAGNVLINVNNNVAGNTREVSGKFIKNGAVELYYDNVKMLSTESRGAILQKADAVTFIVGSTNGGSAQIFLDGDSNGDGNGGDYAAIRHTSSGHFEIVADNPSTGAEIHFKTGNGSHRSTIDASGHFKPAADSTYDLGLTGTRWRNLYADTLYGDGSNLTGINTDLVGDTSPQLGGDLDLNGNNILLDDNEKIFIGTSNDGSLFNSGSYLFLKNHSGAVAIQGTTTLSFQKYDNADIGLQYVVDGEVKLYYDNSKKFETTTYGGLVSGTFLATGNIKTGTDTGSFYAGAGDDLRIRHDGTDSRIDNSTGYLYIDSPNIAIRSDGGQEDSIQALANGAVNLYHNGTKKFETTSAGAQVSGDLAFADNNKVVVGTGSDGLFYHDGFDTILRNTTGNLRIVADNIHLEAGDFGDEMLRCNHDGAVELYYDNSKKFHTTSAGAQVTGSLTLTSHLVLGDGDELKLGASSDMTIWHSGSDFNMYNSTGQLIISNASGTGVGEGDIVFKTGNNNTRAYLSKDGHFYPASNNSFDLGTSSNRWRNVFTNDLNLSNEGGANDVDGTWGDWTIQEGESDLFLKNNRSGKKYKFNLMEVS